MRNILILILASLLLTGCFSEKSINVGEVEGIDNIYAPVIIPHLTIGITTVTVIKIIINSSLNSVHT